MRKRLRDLGISIGNLETGTLNSITDVHGVEVGHKTLLNSKINACTGVTAVWPGRNVFYDRVSASAFVLNGVGEACGITQLKEWGLLETPICLTSTHALGTCADAVTRYMVRNYPSIGSELDPIIPLVAECDDSWLNDSRAFHIQHDDVFQALDSARGGPVEEGSVGAGTGMITLGFKAGIGTSSRKLPANAGDYTVGALVMSNFGAIQNLRVAGQQLGPTLARKFDPESLRKYDHGSIIVILATDAPMLPNQLERLCKRGALGIGRTGGYASNASGDIVLAFSTTCLFQRKLEREAHEQVRLKELKVVHDGDLDLFFEAAADVTEEAILNSLCAADALTGIHGNTAPALPYEDLRRSSSL